MPRTDGDETRRALIEAAGQLAAQSGWSAVKAKDVCALAQVSTASVNYWFGSRDELYEEVVKEIPDGIVPASTLQVMRLATQGRASAKAAIEQFFDEVLAGAEHPERWRQRLWAREMFTGPSETFLKVVDDVGSDRMTVLRNLFAAYLGTEPDSRETSEALLSAVMPCLLCVMVPGRVKEILYPEVFEGGGSGRETMKRVFMQNLKLRKRALEKDRKKAKGKTAAMDNETEQLSAL